MTSSHDIQPSFTLTPTLSTLADSVKSSPRRTDASLDGGQHQPLAGSSSSSVTYGQTRDKSRGTSIADIEGVNGSVIGEAGGDAEVKPKKKKKKGWKGWALVIEDDDGNVLEVRDRGESPESARNAAIANKEARVKEERDGSPVESVPVEEPASPPREKISPDRVVSAPISHTPAPPATSSTPITRQSVSKAPETAKSNEPSTKRRKRSSPLPSLTPQPPSSDPIIPAPPAPIVKSAPPVKPVSVKVKPPPSVKSAPPTRSQQAVVREEARQAQSPSRTTTPVATTSAATTPVIPHATVPDEPSLPKAPRVGMGEIYPTPPESDIRAEAAFIINAGKRKREEDRIRHLREESVGGKQTEINASSLPLVSGSGQPIAEREKTKDDARPRQTNGAARTENGTGDVYANPHSAANGRSSYHGQLQQIPQPINQPHAGPSNHRQRTLPPAELYPRSELEHLMQYDPHHHPHPYPDKLPAHPSPVEYPPDSFEAQFAAVEADYRNGRHSTPISVATSGQVFAQHIIAPQDVALGRGPNDTVPPRFHDGQKPTVALAPQGNRAKIRDRLDKEHEDGFEGLPEQVESDCDGFVENVRENLRNIIFYFFPVPSVRRDAFLERVGRGLTDLGWALTDSGDLALSRQVPPHPRPPHSGM